MEERYHLRMKSAIVKITDEKDCHQVLLIVFVLLQNRIIIIIIITTTTGMTALCEPWPSSGFLKNLIFTV
jgi:hypothetical protein